MGPYEKVIAEQDRDATEQLLKAMMAPETPDEDRAHAIEALRALEDPRAGEVLGQISTDPYYPESIRDAALDILNATGIAPDDPRTLHQWWNEGDETLQKWALLLAGRESADIITPISDDPSHPLYRYAIEAIEFSFEEPEWQQRKIAALQHRNPDIREIAAFVLMWDEPLSAEIPLLKGILDTSENVRQRCYEALAYYPSRNVVTHLQSHKSAPAQAALNDLRVTFIDRLQKSAVNPASFSRLSQWMSPVVEILNITDDELTTSKHESRTTEAAKGPSLSVDQLMEQLSDLGGKWARKIREISAFDWTTVPTDARPEIAEFLVGHPDVDVRSMACKALAGWGDVDRLFVLARDSSKYVRKSGIFYMGELDPSPEVARFAWNLLEDGTVASTSGREALRTYVAHASRQESEERLVELALHDHRDTVRYEAVSLLKDASIPGLFDVLMTPPLVTWGPHVRILERCKALGVRPGQAGALDDVDNLYVAAALADLEPFRG